MKEKTIFSYNKNETIALINSVDTGTATAVVENDNNLSTLQINQLIAIESPFSSRNIVGMIVKIARKSSTNNDDEMEDFTPVNTIKIVFVGELHDRLGTFSNVFKRNVTALPYIDAKCYKIDGEKLSELMKTISAEIEKGISPLNLGKYSMDESSVAYLDGDKFFQRHAAIVGSTGSGKSYCVAKLVEQISDLEMANAILFDIHGEYSNESFLKSGIKQYKIASPNDLISKEKLSNNILMIPYWLLNYEEMQALLLDRSDMNAPNQAMLLSKQILTHKESNVEGTIYTKQITLDSPVPYDLKKVLQKLKELDEEKVEGSRGEKAGPYNGKLTRFNQRLANKLEDKRLGFMFSLTSEEMDVDWLKNFCTKLMGTDDGTGKGVKVIDFSEVPSDILPLVIGLITRIIFSVQQWSDKSSRHPVALLCDEAHLYVQQLDHSDSVAEIGLKSFERIAKEGRKYGVGLVIISQRPSEVNRTVLSQCNNFISLRLTNVEDQSVIKRLLPDNLGNIADNLSLLDIAEAIIVGDATLLPSRIRIDEPTIKPSSQTIKFWQIWGQTEGSQNLLSAIDNMIKQYKAE